MKWSFTETFYPSKTSFWLGVGLKKVQKQSINERTLKDYSKSAVYFCRCQVVLRSFIYAFFPYFFTLVTYYKLICKGSINLSQFFTTILPWDTRQNNTQQKLIIIIVIIKERKERNKTKENKARNKYYTSKQHRKKQNTDYYNYFMLDRTASSSAMHFPVFSVDLL